MSLQTAIERSASPVAVGVALDRLSDAVPGVQARLVADTALRDAVFAVTGASRSLTELLVSDPAALEVLGDLGRRPVLEEGSVEDGPDRQGGLRRWMRLELLRIAARDLTGLDDLPVVGRGLARLADEVLQAAAAATGADPGLAVIGMGKLGGCELNYSSDIDIMFVGDPHEHNSTARAILDIARTCYRVDVDLRPEGRDGPLVRSLESYEAYWERWAHTWEFQALLKARPVAGDAELGAAFLERAQKRVWERPFTLDDLRAVRSMKARSEEMMAKKGLTDREVKRGRGGIRDIEFSVQLLQLVHGRADPALRSPTTLDALAELGSSGYIDPSDARALDAAYRLLRTVEHRLQLVHEQQVHTLPAPTDLVGRDRLARVMGYRDTAEASAGELLDRFLRRQQANVRSIHQHLFFRPLLDALTAGGATDALMSEEAVATRLEAFGFTDAKRTRLALRELTKGLTRSSRLMQQMLPLLLGWLSEAPDPDLGLLGLRVLAAGPAQATELATAFRESPEAARRLCTLLGTSRRLSETLEHHPDMIPALGQPDALLRRPPEALLLGASAALAWRDQVEDRQRGLLRYKRREELRVAAGDVLELAPADEDQVVVTASQLTTLAEASLQAALDALGPPLPFAMIAMGRFGGAELSYASDLDLLFVYDGSTAADSKAADSRRRIPRRRTSRRRTSRRRRRWGSRWSASWPGRRLPPGSTPSTWACAPRARTVPWPAASTATPPTTTGGPRRGSARPWSGPGSWPETPTWAGGSWRSSSPTCGESRWPRTTSARSAASRPASSGSASLTPRIPSSTSSWAGGRCRTWSSPPNSSNFVTGSGPRGRWRPWSGWRRRAPSTPTIGRCWPTPTASASGPATVGSW